MRSNSYIRLSFIIAAALMLSLSVNAEVVADTLRCTIYFPNSETEYNPDYRDNAKRMQALADTIGSAIEGEARLTALSFTGSASPNGITDSNLNLAENRAYEGRNALFALISPGVATVSVKSVGENYALIEDMLTGCQEPWAPEMLAMLRNIPMDARQDGKIVSSLKKSMMELQGGVPYEWMVKHMMPELRRCDIEAMIETDKIFSDAKGNVPAGVERLSACATPAPDLTGLTLAAFQDSAHTILPATVELSDITSSQAHSFIAVGTNLLYDLALTPNISIEWPFAQRWSLAANWRYAWWSIRKSNYYWRNYGGHIALRYRPLTKDLLQGLHVGAYGEMGTFCYEFGDIGWLSPKWNWGAGVEAGYSLRLRESVRLDFTLAAGYVHGVAYRYFPYYDKYIKSRTKPVRWWGPTRVEVTLMWLIDMERIFKK